MKREKLEFKDVAIFAGCSMAYSKLVAQIMVEDMGKIKPQIFPSVPRIWEAVKRGIIRNIESGTDRRVIAEGSPRGPFRTLLPQGVGNMRMHGASNSLIAADWNK